MTPCYDPVRPRWRQAPSGFVILATTAAIVLGAVSADVVLGVLIAIPLALLARCVDMQAARWMLVAVVAAGGIAAVRGHHEWKGLVPTEVGPHRGWARVVDDPRSYESVTRLIVDVDGQRFEAWLRGGDAAVAAELRAGDFVHVEGERRPLAADRAGRVAWQHVVGQYRVDAIGPMAPGSRLAISSNRVRAAIDRGASTLPGPDAALFRGLVVGDRRGQPPELIERFRATGLSHLTVVSGLNVSVLLVAAGPGLRRLRPAARWIATVVLIAWFVALTRFEPSVMRAGTMAAISATAFATGRDRAPARILCIAVSMLVLVDPMLVRSVGFWLSVGATAGVCTVGPWLADRLPGPRWIAAPLGVTVGAQVGVVIPLVAAFGRLPLVSVPANLAAVPVASLVKLYGLPAGLIAGWVPPAAPVIMAPAAVGVRWVDLVSVAAERLEPSGAVAAVGWGVLVAALVVALWLAAAMNRRRDDRPPPHR